MNSNIIIFHKIKFYNKSFSYLFNKINRGGYLVAPAASSLSQIYKNKSYYKAIQKSSVAILDSGFFCILYRLFHFRGLRKFSGLLFLKKFISNPITHKHLLLSIDPDRIESKKNKILLKKFNFSKIASYVAPNYSTVIKLQQDRKLILLIKKIKPKYILINIGGGKQEVLAEYIYNRVNKNTSILCLGAAIAFLTGSQAPIPKLVDKFYLGWLARLVFSPRKFFLRILISFTLVKLFI